MTDNNQPAPRVPCVVDPESFFFMNGDGQLHAHVLAGDGRTRCILDNTCECCGEPLEVCECMGPRTCPRCGSPDLREVLVVETGVWPDPATVEHVDLACTDCTWRTRLPVKPGGVA